MGIKAKSGAVHVLQPLERRRLFAVQVGADIISIGTSEGDDTVTIDRDAQGNYVVVVITPFQNQTHTIPPGNLTKYTVQFGDGNDSLTVGINVPLNGLVLCGSGDDTVNAGSGDDEIFGEEDDDFLHGGDGRDTIEGRGGGDRITGGRGGDWLDGNDGDDKIWGDLGGVLAAYSYGYGYGGLYDDTIRGLGGKDTLYGEDGSDDLQGGDESDEIYGGFGLGFYGGYDVAPEETSDTLRGEQGNDILFGDTPGLDAIIAERGGFGGSDSLLGGDHYDTINGGPGADYLEGGSGEDKMFGDSGADGFAAADGEFDECYGGPGHDLAIKDAIDFFQQD